MQLMKRIINAPPEPDAQNTINDNHRFSIINDGHSKYAMSSAPTS